MNEGPPQPYREDTTNVRMTKCRICAEHGFSVYIFFKQDGTKEDGRPRWIPFDDQEFVERHQHRTVNQIDSFGPLLAKTYEVVLRIEQQLQSNRSSLADESEVF